MSSASPAPPGALVLIDTMGYIFRAFHALPPLSNSRGQPTQAVLGFVNMLRKLITERQPEALAAVYDVAGPTFRDERFAAYKANRAAMPETLAAQLPHIRRVLEAFRVPILQAEGYEADDVLGTVARQAAERGREVLIVSSDKDLLQLVGPRVRVYNPGLNLLLGPDEVQEKLGVPPEQVADLLALRGDSVDNIPGAPGIGEKGAQQLIARYGSVEAAMEHAGEVERKTYRESLQQHQEQIRLSKELATIHTHAPVEYTPEAWRRQEPDAEACRALFTELEFHHLLRALDPGPATAAPAPEPTRELDAAALPRLLAHHEMALAPGADGGLGLAVEGEAGLLPAAALPAVQALLAAALADPQRQWAWEDSRALAAALAPLGLPRPALQAERVSDVALLGYLDDPTQTNFSLDSVARRLGLVEAVTTRPAPERPGGADQREAAGAQPPAKTGCACAGQAAASTLAAAKALRQRAHDTGQWAVYRDLDLPLLPVLEDMEATGVTLDPAPLAVLSLELERRCLECQEKVFELAGVRFNLNSPQQLGEVLFTKLGLPAPAKRGKSKAPSTAMDVLEGLAAYPVVQPILEYRQLSKLKSTYVDALPPLIRAATGRLHTTFVLTGSATGRLASINPNLQNIPIRTEVGRQIRAAFLPAPGAVLLAADYSQIEVRLLAHFSQDPLLLQAFRTDADIHRLTAAEVFGVPPMLISDEHRRRAKAVNFGIVYGLSAFGLARQLGIPQAEAAAFIRRYFERYAGVKGYIERALTAARQEGAVRTLFGRRRPIPNLDSRNPTLRGFAERTAINTPLQGTAADLIKLAMTRLHPKLPALGAHLLLQVHDELVLEVPEAHAPALAGIVRAAMENVAELAVPLRVDIGTGPNWRDIA